jgi:hypothetical protein
MGDIPEDAILHSHRHEKPQILQRQKSIFELPTT